LRWRVNNEYFMNGSSKATTLPSQWAKPPVPKLKKVGRMWCSGPKSKKWAKAPSEKLKKCAILDLGLV